jgi:hypothetical protein
MVDSKEVKWYSILVYGSKDGYQNNRSQIQLSDAAGTTLAWLRFKDADMPFEDDSNDNGIIKMHLPSTAFGDVVDLLRNEGPWYIYFAQGRGFLSSSKETIGEGEH